MTNHFKTQDFVQLFKQVGAVRQKGRPLRFMQLSFANVELRFRFRVNSDLSHPYLEIHYYFTMPEFDKLYNYVDAGKPKVTGVFLKLGQRDYSESVYEGYRAISNVILPDLVAWHDSVDISYQLATHLSVDINNHEGGHPLKHLTVLAIMQRVDQINRYINLIESGGQFALFQNTKLEKFERALALAKLPTSVVFDKRKILTYHEEFVRKSIKRRTSAETIAVILAADKEKLKTR